MVLFQAIFIIMSARGDLPQIKFKKYYRADRVTVAKRHDRESLKQRALEYPPHGPAGSTDPYGCGNDKLISRYKFLAYRAIRPFRYVYFCWGTLDKYI